jgi:hypothetical protein
MKLVGSLNIILSTKLNMLSSVNSYRKENITCLILEFESLNKCTHMHWALGIDTVKK